MLVYNEILEDNKAKYMADEMGIDEVEAAKNYFKEIFESDDFSEQQITYKKFEDSIPEIGCDLFHDFVGGYYFIVKEENNSMSNSLNNNVENKHVNNMANNNAQTIRMNESQLRDLVKEGIKNILNEYRGMTFDPDYIYTRPNGENNIPTKLKWYNSNPGKRNLQNVTTTDFKTGKQKQTGSHFSTMFSTGKGKLCLDAEKKLCEIFQVASDSGLVKTNGKIQWTEKELDAINNIFSSLYKLAILSKEEGNRARGYNG